MPAGQPPTSNARPSLPNAQFVPKRIALCIHALHGGGAERLMSQLAGRWAKQGHEIHLITWSATSTDTYPVPTDAVRHGLNLVRESRNALDGLRANLRRVKRLKETLGQIKPELILSFADQMNIAALSASKRMRVPVWIAEHSDPQHQRLSRFWETWRNRVYPRATGAVVLTPAIRDYFRRWLPEERLRVIPPAITAKAKGETSPQEQRHKHSQDEAHAPLKQILFVGRLSPEKDLNTLLSAWKIAAERLPDWQLEIVGDGPESNRLQQQASQIPRVSFAGWSNNPEEHYCRSSIFALSSRYEGFPVALLEAMNNGLPCVSTRCSSAIEQLNTPDQCILTAVPGDAAALAGEINRLASHEQLRQQMAQAAYQRAQQFYWQTIGPKWDRITE